MLKRLQRIFLCVVLCVGVQSGVYMRPEEIQELMRTMNQPKIVRTYAEEDPDDDPIAKLNGVFRIF